MSPYLRRHIVALLLATSTLVPACSHEAAEEVETEAVVPVETEPAKLGDVTAVIHATGIITAAPGAELIVVAPEAARIVELPKGVGDTVKQGDLLVRFDIPSSTAEVTRQEGEGTKAKAQLANARAAQTRARELFERGVGSRKEMEDADRDFADAEAAVAQAQAGLDASQRVAGRTVVRAPFAGVVVQRHHNPGDVVEAASGDPVLRLVDPRRVEVVAAVPLADLTRVKTGAEGRLPSQEGVTLRVVTRPAAVDAASGTAPVRLAFKGALAGLPVGLPVPVDIDAEVRTGVLTVPVGAIVRDGDDTAVLVAEGEKAARKPVTLGVSDGERVEVTAGIANGDRVIVRGQAGLPDGARISTGGKPAEGSEKP